MGGRLERPTAAISIDVESDYNSRQYQALGRLDEMLETIQRLEVPLTAFVEGQFFADRQWVPERLVSAGVDVQLHCYDHLGPGDRPEDLRRGVAAYERFMGRRPRGYRAHTYRLTRELAEALIAEGFAWDSSILPAVAQGGNAAAAFRAGDYFVLGERLVELPLATWPGLPIPLIHSYRLMMRPLGEGVLRRLFGLPRLLVYDMHMHDLVWSRSLATSPLPRTVKLMYQFMWGTNRGTSLGALAAFVVELRRRGYAIERLDDIARRVAPRSG